MQTKPVLRLIIPETRAGIKEKIMNEKLLSANELAQLWGVSVYTIHRLANQRNGLKACKIGRLTRFRPSDVEAYLATNEIKPPEKDRGFACQRFTYKPGMKVVSL